MDKIIYTVGAMVCALVTAAMVCLIIYYLGTRLINFVERKPSKVDRAVKQTTIDIGSHIVNAAYWFSADPRVFNALMSIGRDLIEYQNFDPDKIRQTVREKGDKKIS